MKLSKQKREKIAEQLLSHLYHNFPQPLFTSRIAHELARDEEFTKTLLFELKQKKLVQEINKNPDGVFYTRRKRWILSTKVYETFKKQF